MYVKVGTTWNIGYGSDDPSVQIRTIDRTYFPSFYNPGDPSSRGDIALLHLNSPVAYSDYVRPVCLPDSNVDLSQFKTCAATGFGASDTCKSRSHMIVTHSKSVLAMVMHDLDNWNKF